MRNCCARFVAWNETEGDTETEALNKKCGLCDPLKGDNFKNCVPLMAQITAPRAKRDYLIQVVVQLLWSAINHARAIPLLA